MKVLDFVKFSQLLDLFGAEETVVAEVRKEEVRRRPVSLKWTAQLRFAQDAERAVEGWLQTHFVTSQIVVLRGFLCFILELTALFQ